MTGLHLSHYAIDSELGRGGMGVVFRAKDTKLNRTVALKVLPAGALASEDDRARFRREAQAAAQLNHPNVCHVYEVDEAQPLTPEGKPVEGQTESRLFIAMEFIDGQTLHEYIGNGPLKLQEAVNIAGQVAEALKKAHAKNIVHRDIKSANIMLTDGGVAKVLDFGLAKTNQSTMLTRMGSTLGTVAYMSPEQARGEEVDGRSDLYSLGTVLYEMVAGRLPYSGDYEQAILYGILNEAPEPLTALRTGVPMQLEWIVDKLLKKEAEYRYQSAAGLLADLKSLDLSGSGRTQRMAAVGASGLPSAEPATVPRWVWGAMAVVALLAGAAGWALRHDGGAPPSPPMHLTIDLPQASAEAAPDWSPDGTRILYGVFDESGPRLAEFDLTTGRAVDVPGTQGAHSGRYSPEETYILFRKGTGPSAQLYRLPAGSGQPVLVADGVATSMYAWFSESRFIFGSPAGVMVHDLTSEESTVLIRSDSLRIPEFGTVLSPDKRFLYFASSQGAVGGFYVHDLKSGRETQIRDAFVIPRYFTPSGRLVALEWADGRLIDQPMDPETGLPAGPRTPHYQAQVLSDALAPQGHLVFEEILGAGAPAGEPMYWLGSSGSLDYIGEFDNDIWNEFDVSPDGSRAVVEANSSASGWELHDFDLETGVSVRLLPGASYHDPIYNWGGEAVFFAKQEAGLFSIQRVQVDGLREPVDVVAGATNDRHPGVDATESHMVFQRQSEETGWDIWIKNLDSGEERALVAVDGDQTRPAISGDGRLFAFESISNGQASVLLGEVNGGWLTDVGAGIARPKFSQDGEGLFFSNEVRNTILMRRLDSDSRPYLVGSDREVLSLPFANHIHYAPAPGDALAVVSFIGVASQQTGGWKIVLNWASTLK